MNNRFFDQLNEWIRETEGSIVNFLSAFAPWLAPLTPAYMTYQHATGPLLQFPVWVAAPAALVVEILGFSTVSTYMAFWFFNKKNKADSRRAPVGLVVVAFIFYLAIVLFSNVMLDTFPNEAWTSISVRALFTLQTIPAALIVAVRTQHRDMLQEYETERKQKLAERAEQEFTRTEKVTESYRNFPQQLEADWRHIRPTLGVDDLQQIATLDDAGIVRIMASRQVSISERTAGNWRKYSKREIAQLQIKPQQQEEIIENE